MADQKKQSYYTSFDGFDGNKLPYNKPFPSLFVALRYDFDRYSNKNKNNNKRSSTTIINNATNNDDIQTSNDSMNKKTANNNGNPRNGFNSFKAAILDSDSDMNTDTNIINNNNNNAITSNIVVTNINTTPPTPSTTQNRNENNNSPIPPIPPPLKINSNNGDYSPVIALSSSNIPIFQNRYSPIVSKNGFNFEPNIIPNSISINNNNTTTITNENNKKKRKFSDTPMYSVSPTINVTHNNNNTNNNNNNDISMKKSRSHSYESHNSRSRRNIPTNYYDDFYEIERTLINMNHNSVPFSKRLSRDGNHIDIIIKEDFRDDVNLFKAFMDNEYFGMISDLATTCHKQFQILVSVDLRLQFIATIDRCISSNLPVTLAKLIFLYILIYLYILGYIYCMICLNNMSSECIIKNY